MSKFFKMFGAVGILASMMMVAGCGDDAAPAVATKSTTVAATVVGQTATTTAAVSATPKDSTLVAVAIPNGVAITATTGTMPSAANLVINVSTPANGTTSGVTAPKVGTTSFTVTDAAGAVDISIPSVDTFTVGGAGATVKIPVIKAPLNTVNPEVVTIKANGTSAIIPAAQTSYTPPATGTISATNPGTVTVTGVTSFCWFIVNPTYQNASGATGSYGTIVK